MSRKYKGATSSAIAYTDEMSEVMKSEWFFFISSIGFTIIGILVVILLVRIIQAIDLFKVLVEKMESEVSNLGDTAQEIMEDFRGSFVYQMIFRPQRKRSSNSKVISKKIIKKNEENK